MAFEKGVEGIVPFAALTRCIIFRKCLVDQQETDGKGAENPESSHYPVDLEWRKYEQILNATQPSLHEKRLIRSYIFCFSKLSYMVTRNKVNSQRKNEV